MFEAAEMKLEDARIQLGLFRETPNGPKRRAIFSALLSALRSIPNAILYEGPSTKEFEEWKKGKQKEQKEDPLLSWVKTARDSCYHEGKANVNWSMTNVAQHTFTIKGYGWHLTPDGVLRDASTGKPLLTVPRNVLRISTSVENPPRSHLGRAVASDDPVVLCDYALIYYKTVVGEAKARFDGTS